MPVFSTLIAISNRFRKFLMHEIATWEERIPKFVSAIYASLVGKTQHTSALAQFRKIDRPFQDRWISIASRLSPEFKRVYSFEGRYLHSNSSEHQEIAPCFLFQ